MSEVPLTGSTTGQPHTMSIVIPVYQGETTLPAVISELSAYTSLHLTPNGHRYIVSEVLLVWDNGPDDSAATIHRLEREYPWVRGVWLSKNFGQHAATLAGMASAGSDWVVTIDEDGQHDPTYISAMLDQAMRERASVVYAAPVNALPHGLMRNTASKGAKWLLAKSAGVKATEFQSYRLIVGTIARSVAAYTGSGVFLDIAISWVAGKVTTAPVVIREEGDRPSGYSWRSLFFGHFLKLVVSSGTRILRLVAGLGILFALVGIVMAVYILVTRLATPELPAGWASTMVVVLVGTGAVLFALGVVAEYLGVNVDMAMGKPPYLIITDPDRGPLGRVTSENSAEPSQRDRPFPTQT